MKKILITLLVIIAIVVGYRYYQKRQAPVAPAPAPDQGTAVEYFCDGGRTIDATFYDGPTAPPATPDGPPIPGGRAHIVLSDGRTLDLAQTISADGVRYANVDESLVFWNKGNGALVLENNEEKSFVGCVRVAPQPEDSGLSHAFSSGADGFSIRLPDGFVPDQLYQYQLAPAKAIAGVKFTIAPALAQGTNLSKDSYISVESIPSTSSCTADLFLDGTHDAMEQTEGDTQYSVSFASGAGAGNRYEETVYALPGTNPCVAVRYFVHYTVVQNYPAGTVTEFDKDALIARFDAIRRTLVVNQ